MFSFGFSLKVAKLLENMNLSFTLKHCLYGVCVLFSIWKFGRIRAVDDIANICLFRCYLSGLYAFVFAFLSLKMSVVLVESGMLFSV